MAGRDGRTWPPARGLSLSRPACPVPAGVAARRAVPEGGSPRRRPPQWLPRHGTIGLVMQVFAKPSLAQAAPGWKRGVTAPVGTSGREPMHTGKKTQLGVFPKSPCRHVLSERPPKARRAGRGPRGGCSAARGPALILLRE